MHETDDLEDRIVPPREVEKITGLSRSTIWREQKAGRFPQYVSLSPGRVGGINSEILAWLRARRHRELVVPVADEEAGDDL